MKTLWLILRPRARKVNNLRTLLITAILSSLVLSATVQAGVAIGLTRVIVTGADKSGSVQILNDGLHPALLQLWVDNNIAEMDKPIEQINVPFVVDSPVFRLNAKTNKSIRIYYTGGANQLPSDRESMFWLNVLEVPPKASANQSSQNAVQIAFRSRIKLFYRPAGIPISSEGVATKLSFTLVPKGRAVYYAWLIRRHSMSHSRHWLSPKVIPRRASLSNWALMIWWDQKAAWTVPQWATTRWRRI